MRLALLLWVLLGFRPVQGADSVLVATNSLLVQNHGTLSWATPAGWKYTPPRADPAGISPAYFLLQGPDGHPSLLVTVLWDGIGPKKLSPTDGELADMVKKAAEEKFIPSSVEKELGLSPFAGGRAHGHYASFTDLKYAGKEAKDVPPTEFRVATIGAFRAGGLWGNFTLYTNAKDGPQLEQGLAVVKSFGGTPVTQ